MRTREEMLAREAVRLDGGAESLGAGEEGVQVRQDLVFRDVEQRLPLRIEIHRSHRLHDEMADAAIVGGAENGVEVRHVQPRRHDLVRHADARAERLGQGVEHRDALQSLAERGAVVADRVHGQLPLDLRRVERDVEILEAGLQDAQRERGVRERTEVGRHAEAGEADRLRQRHVLEELGMDRRLAAREEEHVELAGVVEDELPRDVGLRHRAMRWVELLHAEDAVAVARAGAADVQHPQPLVPGTALGLVAETDRQGIGRREPAYQGIDVRRAPFRQHRQPGAALACGVPAHDAIQGARQLGGEGLQRLGLLGAVRAHPEPDRLRRGTREEDETTVGEAQHGIVEREPADARFVDRERDGAVGEVDLRRDPAPRLGAVGAQRLRALALRVRLQRRDQRQRVGCRRALAERTHQRDQHAAGRFVRPRAAAAAVHEQEVERVGVRDAERRPGVATDGDAGAAALGMRQQQGRGAGADRAQRLDRPAEREGRALAEGREQRPRRLSADLGLRRPLVAWRAPHLARGRREDLVAELVPQGPVFRFARVGRGARTVLGIAPQRLEADGHIRSGLRDDDPRAATVLVGRELDRVATIEVGMEADRFRHGHAAPSTAASSRRSCAVAARGEMVGTRATSARTRARNSRMSASIHSPSAPACVGSGWR